eukprot:scaffold55723_cov63-Phaeocystis_antarctica.AAC.4
MQRRGVVYEGASTGELAALGCGTMVQVGCVRPGGARAHAVGRASTRACSLLFFCPSTTTLAPLRVTRLPGVSSMAWLVVAPPRRRRGSLLVAPTCTCNRTANASKESSQSMSFPIVRFIMVRALQPPGRVMGDNGRLFVPDSMNGCAVLVGKVRRGGSHMTHSFPRRNTTRQYAHRGQGAVCVF